MATFYHLLPYSDYKVVVCTLYMAPARIARVAGLELAITMNSSVERGLKFEIEVYTAILSLRYISNSISQVLIATRYFFLLRNSYFCVLYSCYFFSCINVICGVCQLRLPWEIKEFCLKTFLPEIRLATSNLRPLPEDEMKKLRGNFLGTVIKLAYGGIWEVSCI